MFFIWKIHLNDYNWNFTHQITKFIIYNSVDRLPVNYLLWTTVFLDLHVNSCFWLFKNQSVLKQKKMNISGCSDLITCIRFQTGFFLTKNCGGVVRMIHNHNNYNILWQKQFIQISPLAYSRKNFVWDDFKQENILINIITMFFDKNNLFE